MVRPCVNSCVSLNAPDTVYVCESFHFRFLLFFSCYEILPYVNGTLRHFVFACNISKIKVFKLQFFRICTNKNQMNITHFLTLFISPNFPSICNHTPLIYQLSTDARFCFWTDLISNHAGWLLRHTFCKTDSKGPFFLMLLSMRSFPYWIFLLYF